MSVFDRLRAFFGDKPVAEVAPGPSTPPTAAVAPLRHDEPSLPAELIVLQSLAAQNGDDPRALPALRALRGTIHERAALRAILAATEARRAPEELRLEAASLFVARGEHAAARHLLVDAASVAALLVRAEAEERGADEAAAREALERILARDIDAVGVRARLNRLREAAGLLSVVPLSAQPTITTAEETRASFRIVAEIGRGGASAVFRAEDLLLGRTLALKVFHRPREHRAQLQREAELAVRARGPHVVRVFDADPDQGFLAMELATGGALRRALRGPVDGKAPGSHLDSWLSPLVQALARVHGLGLVHGDVKAGNVLFRGDGTPLLADFGLARAPGEPYDGGTPGTLSPERARDGVAHEDDDVFALGVLVGEALARGVTTSFDPVALRALVQRWTAPRGERPRSARELVLPGS